MGKFLTYIAIFALAIPTATVVIIIVILALILLLAAILFGRKLRKSSGPSSPGGWHQQQGEIRSDYPSQQSSPPYAPGSAPFSDKEYQRESGLPYYYPPSSQPQSSAWQQPTALEQGSVPQQAPGVEGKSSIPESDNWMQSQLPQSQAVGSVPPASGGTWSDLTMANTSIEPTQRVGAISPPQAATTDKIVNPAHVILRSENGTTLHEYPLEKPEISIGRAPNSDILLSKDNLTSRRHATIRYENGNYVLHDEHSANGTFINGQQLEEKTSRVLQDGDHVGIGEHELTFHGYSAASTAEDMPTMAVQYNPISVEETYRTREDTFYTDKDANVPEHDDFSTRSIDNSSSDLFAQWIQAVPAPPPESSSRPPAQTVSAPPSHPGVQYGSAVPEPPKKLSAIPPVPSTVASRSVSTTMPESVTPVYSPEQLRFTAFHPKEVIVETWNTLLVYAHIEPVVEMVYKDAERFKAELGAAPRKVSTPATQLVIRETNITFVPECKGVTFNPKRFTFKWLEDWHRASFRFQAKPELAGSAGNGRINIFAGSLLVGTLKLPLLFEEQDTALPVHSEDIQETTQLYKQIFASYSHDDSLIVLTCRDVFKTLGYNTLIDIDTLRAGQKFSDALKRMIDAADIFQLFWSERSAKSRYVAEEWQYALNLNKGEGFVRPVYWEVPMVEPPEKLAPLHFAYLPAYTFNQQQSPSR